MYGKQKLWDFINNSESIAVIAREDKISSRDIWITEDQRSNVEKETRFYFVKEAFNNKKSLFCSLKML